MFDHRRRASRQRVEDSDATLPPNEAPPTSSPPRVFPAPVDYSSRTRYRKPPDVYRRVNATIGPVINYLGLSPRDVVMLEVPGRRSGVVHHSLLVRTDVNGVHYLISLAGESDWVRNVRAALGKVVVGRRRRQSATLVELPVGERAPMLRAYLWRWGRRADSKSLASEARFYFGVRANASLEEIGEAAEHYPVFRIDYDGLADTTRGWGK